MLTHISIQNFIIIRQLELEFGAGFTVFTGETGAGKSIITTAISLVCGAPSQQEMIGDAKDTCIIEGTFDITHHRPLFADYIEPQETTLTITRIISKSNRNSARLNGQTVPLKKIQELTSHLVNIIGQHEFTKLMDEKSQLDLLDQFAGSPLENLRIQFQDALSIYKETDKKLTQLNATATPSETMVDYLKFQINDIDQHHFIQTEDATLKEQKNAYKTLQKNKTSLSKTSSLLTTGYDILTQALSSMPDDYASQKAQLQTTITLIEDVLETTSKTLYSNEAPIDINQIEDRLDLLFRYKSKYKVATIDQLITLSASLKDTLKIAETKAEIEAELIQKRAKDKETAIAIAKKMHEFREVIAKKAEEKIITNLKELHFDTPKCRFKLDFDPSQLKETGCTRCTLIIQPNEGQKEGPIAQIGSGGELSRVILAIRSSLIESSPPPTMIFDEVDAGVGGLTANKIGEKMVSLAKKSQILCVTHLPQIAKFATMHISVSKKTVNKQTDVITHPLNPSEKREELERMIGGKEMLTLIHQPN